MKTTVLLFFLIFSHSAFSQKSSRPELINFKITPTSIFNAGKPNLLMGVEILPNEKIGIQVEYGAQLASVGRSPNGLNLRDKSGWLYQRIKSEIKFYTFRKPGFADYLSGGILYSPQNYTSGSDFVQLKNGETYSFSSARIQFDELNIFGNYGGKIWFGNTFFIEYYMGGGLQQTHVHIIKMDNATLSTVSINAPAKFALYNFSTRDQAEGKRYQLFVDFGVKVGVSF